MCVNWGPKSRFRKSGLIGYYTVAVQVVNRMLCGKRRVEIESVSILLISYANIPRLCAVLARAYCIEVQILEALLVFKIMRDDWTWNEENEQIAKGDRRPRNIYLKLHVCSDRILQKKIYRDKEMSRTSSYFISFFVEVNCFISIQIHSLCCI
jgi:hypothetical protein